MNTLPANSFHAPFLTNCIVVVFRYIMSCKCIDGACAAVYCFVIVYIAGEVVEGLKTVHCYTPAVCCLLISLSKRPFLLSKNYCSVQNNSYNVNFGSVNTK